MAARLCWPQRIALNRSIRSISAALATTALAVLAGLFSAGAFGADSKILGRGDDQLKPDCGPKPESDCFAIGTVTGFITKLGETEDPFVAPSDGKIVAWAIELGHKPSDKVPEDAPEGTKSNLDFFQDLFGSERFGEGPAARLAILRRDGGSVRFKLRSQSPAVKLSGPFYNEDTVITLEDPLPIREGEVVGLTSLTWLPTLREKAAGGGPAGWRASRLRDECGPDDARTTRAHKKEGSIREYGCKFNDRLFYKAYFVPNN